MYGTIVRFRPLPGKERDAQELTRQWLQERAPRVPGFIGEYELRPDAERDEWFALVIFDSEENYRKNASDPDQDRWYRQLRATLAADPEWNDGEIVALQRETVPL
jgi:heme-degrading monooxygenase HmoA